MPGTSILAWFEFEWRLHQLGVDSATRTAELGRYRGLLDEVIDVTETVRKEAMRLAEPTCRTPIPLASVSITLSAVLTTFIRRNIFWRLLSSFLIVHSA